MCKSKADQENRNPERGTRAWFGAELRSIRERVGGRYNLGTLAAVAAKLDMNEGSYGHIESGNRLFHYRHYQILRKLFEHDYDTLERLENAYNATYGNKLETEPALQGLFRISPARFLKEVEKIVGDLKTRYERGDIEGAGNIARTAWPLIRRTGHISKPTLDMALCVARVHSQVGNNREAIELLDDLMPLAAGPEPAMLCHIALSRASCLTRLRHLSGEAGAREFANVAGMVENHLSIRKALKDPVGAWVVCDAYRSRILALGEGFRLSNAQAMKGMWQDFYGVVEVAERYDELRNHTRVRVLAMTGHEDEALDALPALRTSAVSFGSLSFHTHTEVLALLARGERARAASVAYEWMEKCNRNGSKHKQKLFARAFHECRSQ